MDSKTREKILHRCEILRYMGDDGISCIFDQLPDDELMEDCGWVLDKAHDDLDQYQFGVTKKIINDRAPKANSNDMWGQMNYSQKVLFDDWINKCPIEGVFVDEPVSQVKMDDGQFGYLVKVFLTINKEDWEQNQSPPGFSENLPSQNRL